MRAIITVFKIEFKYKEHVIESLKEFSNIEDIDDALIIRPSEGNLFSVLNLLNEHKISYGTYFNSHGEAT